MQQQIRWVDEEKRRGLCVLEKGEKENVHGW